MGSVGLGIELGFRVRLSIHIPHPAPHFVPSPGIAPTNMDDTVLPVTCFVFTNGMSHACLYASAAMHHYTLAGT